MTRDVCELVCIPDKAVLQLQEPGVSCLLHLTDAQQARLPALMASPHILDMSCCCIKAWVSPQFLPCYIPPAPPQTLAHTLFTILLSLVLQGLGTCLPCTQAKEDSWCEASHCEEYSCAGICALPETEFITTCCRLVLHL